MSLNPSSTSDFKVAIIGRPNVGKSTLFNILTASRKSVVKDQAGVTRDIISSPCEIWGKTFELIDTGGLTESNDVFSKLIREQLQDFLSIVDRLIVVVDGRVGLIPEDREIIRLCRELSKPYLLVVNKVDSVHEAAEKVVDFYELDEHPVATAFETRQGIAEIMEWIHAQIPEAIMQYTESIRMAFVGKPNVGKSSLVNQILGSHRMIVSDIAGTTVDSVDSAFRWKDHDFVIVDTAGLRKSSKREDHIEIIAAFKSQEAIRRAEVIAMVIDAREGPSEQDAKILDSIIEDHKGVLIIANKMDLAEKEIPEARKKFREQCERIFHFYVDVPIVFASAVTGKGVEEVLEKVVWLDGKLKTRIPTPELNDFFFDVIRKAPAPVHGTRNVKFYYLTQTKQKPPSFIAFANFPDGVDNSYRRFLSKNLKTHFGLEGIPVRIFVMRSRGA